MGTTGEALQRQSAYWEGLGATSFWIGGDRRILSLALRARTELVAASLCAKG